jgi:hypothetical protein
MDYSQQLKELSEVLEGSLSKLNRVVFLTDKYTIQNQEAQNSIFFDTYIKNSKKIKKRTGENLPLPEVETYYNSDFQAFYYIYTDLNTGEFEFIQEVCTFKTELETEGSKSVDYEQLKSDYTKLEKIAKKQFKKIQQLKEVAKDSIKLQIDILQNMANDL